MNDAMGLLFAALAALSYAAMTLLVRKAGQGAARGDGVLVALVVNVVLHGAIVAIRTSNGIAIPWATAGVAWFVVSGLLTTLLGRVALYGGIRRVGPSRAAALKNLAPFVSVGAAVWLLGERVSVLAGLGVGLALACYTVFMLDGYRSATALTSTPRALATAPPGGHGAAAARRVGEGRRGGERPRPDRGLLIGYGACTAAAVFYGAGTVVRRIGLDAMPDPYVGALLSAVAGLSVFVLYLRAKGQLRSAAVAALSEPKPFYWLAGVASTVGQLALFVALSLTAVSYVSVVAASDTIITMLLAVALFGRSEALTRPVIFAAVGIFLATFLIAIG